MSALIPLPPSQNALSEQWFLTRSFAARTGFLALLLGFAGFIAWASWAPLSEGVAANGAVALDRRAKSVQHLTGGIVATINVREGQMVKEGEVLVELDEGSVKASLEGIRQRYLSRRVLHSRLLAEQANLEQIDFHPDLKAAAGDPQVQALMLTQEKLFASRKLAVNAELRGFQDAIAGQQALFKSAQSMQESRTRQLDLLQDELRHTAELVRDGFVPRNRQLELERAIAEVQASASETLGTMQRTTRGISEIEQRRIVRQQERSKEIEDQLTNIAGEVEADAERLSAVEAEFERIRIKSPASGQVVGLSVNTVGGVVQPGQKLMDIVPTGEPLVLEAMVMPQWIDKVREGLATDVRFTAFSQTPNLTVQGQVVSISRDLLVDQRTGNSHYLARIQITPEGMQKLGDREMQPGMPAQVMIKTGERSMLSYLTAPLLRRVASSMHEE